MIESVHAQTYADWELCMADGSDAEHSDVERICREYAEKDNRIRYRKLEKNLGISGNTNACLEMVTGDYIGLFDHDDLLHPAALYEVMRTIENTGADFVYTDETIFHDTPEDAYLPHFKPDFAPDTLRTNNYICHFTVFKRALLDEVGLFDPACDGSQDFDMVLRLTEKARRTAHIVVPLIDTILYLRVSGVHVRRGPRDVRQRALAQRLVARLPPAFDLFREGLLFFEQIGIGFLESRIDGIQKVFIGFADQPLTILIEDPDRIITGIISLSGSSARRHGFFIDLLISPGQVFINKF